MVKCIIHWFKNENYYLFLDRVHRVFDHNRKLYCPQLLLNCLMRTTFDYQFLLVFLNSNWNFIKNFSQIRPRDHQVKLVMCFINDIRSQIDNQRNSVD